MKVENHARISDFLPFARMNVFFNEANTYEVDSHDIYELTARLGINCLNVIIIRKNSFFLLFKGVNDAYKIFKKLNNYFIDKLQARIEILMCVRSAISSFPPANDKYKAIFEIEVPDFNYFDVQRRFQGVDGYNFDRLQNLTDKEFFEGEVYIQQLGVEREARTECKLTRRRGVYHKYIQSINRGQQKGKVPLLLQTAA